MRGIALTLWDRASCGSPGEYSPARNKTWGIFAGKRFRKSTRRNVASRDVNLFGKVFSFIQRDTNYGRFLPSLPKRNNRIAQRLAVLTGGQAGFLTHVGVEDKYYFFLLINNINIPPINKAAIAIAPKLNVFAF